MGFVERLTADLHFAVLVKLTHTRKKANVIETLAFLLYHL